MKLKNIIQKKKLKKKSESLKKKLKNLRNGLSKIEYTIIN